jgi:hypothetical protein
MAKYGLEAPNREKHAAKRAIARGRLVASLAGEADRLTIEMVCPTHGETEFVVEGRGSSRCKRCRSEAVTARRRRVKAILIQESGGGCALCGYDRCARALSFHHLAPSQKRLVISA